jgi:hypothetical protein
MSPTIILLLISSEVTEPFSYCDLAGSKDVDGLGQLPGAPGAAAELRRASTISPQAASCRMMPQIRGGGQVVHGARQGSGHPRDLAAWGGDDL